MTRETKQQFMNIDARQCARNISINEVTMVVVEEEVVVMMMVVEEVVVMMTMSQRRRRRRCWRSYTDASRPEFHHLDVDGPTVVLRSGQSDGVQNPVLLVTEHACNKTSHVTRHMSHFTRHSSNTMR